jgi:hypothetical protein
MREAILLQRSYIIKYSYDKTVLFVFWHTILYLMKNENSFSLFMCTSNNVTVIVYVRIHLMSADTEFQCCIVNFA